MPTHEMRDDIASAINHIAAIIADAIIVSGMSKDDVAELKNALAELVVAIKR